IYPLAYLIDRSIVEKIKAADSFARRVAIVTDYYQQIIQHHQCSLMPVDIVTEILKTCEEQNNFETSVEQWAAHYNISSRTLQRYFEATTSISSKQALQILRIRKAVEQLVAAPEEFHFRQFGYYDYSHFYKHLKLFLNKHTVAIAQPHLHLLRSEPAVSSKSF
ncbi:MAG: helix-turn-helix domain-containing protein, partial [Bacteroidota bacterium]|nr:helix-turn-helix domain-containing protein [Bacteroidota bacterium]